MHQWFKRRCTRGKGSCDKRWVVVMMMMMMMIMRPLTVFTLSV
jgi:hypothetical protein